MYSQYLVSGCNVTSSVVVNVTRFQLVVIAMEVGRVYRSVWPGLPTSSARMETCGVGVSAA